MSEQTMCPSAKPILIFTLTYIVLSRGRKWETSWWESGTHLECKRYSVSEDEVGKVWPKNPGQHHVHKLVEADRET